MDEVLNGPLNSEQDIDYSRLRDLLKDGKWEDADRETLAVMLQAANRKSEGWLDEAALKQFPCKDLKTINQLWVSASNGHFGFSVQKKIWEECGSPMSTGQDWDRFCVSVGWQNSAATAYLNYSDLKRNPLISPAGELPRSPTSTVVSLDVFMSGAAGVCCLFSRAKTCELQHVTVLGIFKHLSRWLRHPKNLFPSDRPSGSPF